MTIISSMQKFFNRDNNIDEILSTCRNIDDAYQNLETS